MHTVDYRGYQLPTKEQELLLMAALLRGSAAIDAWLEWKSSVNVDRLDQHSYRLLPLLYRNLSIHGVEDPLLNKFRGIHRLTWYKNRVMFHNMATLIRHFNDAGIDTILLKGAALVLRYYEDHGLRPMIDFDILG